MPTRRGIGFGVTTHDKELGFENIISQHLAIVKAIQKKRNWFSPYNYIDAMSGQGDNPECNCDGSPLIFLKCAEREGIKYIAKFIEVDHSNYLKLREKLTKTFPKLNFGRYRICHGRYEYEIGRILEHPMFPGGAFGLIYFDPTGKLDFGIIEELCLSNKVKRMDILIHFSPTTHKRLSVAFPTKYKRLDLYLNKIHKKEWLVRDDLGDCHQHGFLFGTNYVDYKAMESDRWFNIKSKKGLEIITRWILTKDEYNKISNQLYGSKRWFK